MKQREEALNNAGQMKGRERMSGNEWQGLSIIVKNVSSLLVIPITIFGIYVILHGHLTPGGGFPGGAIIGTATAMLLVAFGKDKIERALSKGFFFTLEGIGLVLFALAGFVGIGVTFFNNILLKTGPVFNMALQFGPNPGYINTAGVIPIMNIAVGLEVFASLSLVVLLLFAPSKEEAT